MLRATRGSLTLAAALALALLASCGGDGAAETTPASPATSRPASPSAQPSPAHAPSPPRLSRFEARPQVAALRAWAVAYGRAINAGNRDYPTMRPLMTDAGFQGLVEYLAPDDEGLRYPGPVPFTPTAVHATGRTATVPVCTWVQGWAQDPATKQPARPKEIAPSRFTLEREGGRWRVSGFYLSKGETCARVSVKGVGW